MARQNLRKYFREFPDSGILLTSHAHERMQEREIQLPQIRTVLERGQIRHVETDIKTGLDKYRVAGRDADGRPLETVVNLDETGDGLVTVITVIDSGGSGGRA